MSSCAAPSSRPGLVGRGYGLGNDPDPATGPAGLDRAPAVPVPLAPHPGTPSARPGTAPRAPLVAPFSPYQPAATCVKPPQLGWNDVGFRSHQIATPNIDDLAARGVTLDQYYVQSVCSPSRCTFLSGYFPNKHGVQDWIPPASSYGLPLNLTTLPEQLASAGYDARAVVGTKMQSHSCRNRGFPQRTCDWSTAPTCSPSCTAPAAGVASLTRSRRRCETRGAPRVSFGRPACATVAVAVDPIPTPSHTEHRAGQVARR